MLLGKGGAIRVDDLPAQVTARAESTFVLDHAVARQLTLHDLERDYIGRVLQNAQGNKTEAARILGVDRTTLYRKLEEYKLKD